jgi:MFS family permease
VVLAILSLLPAIGAALIWVPLSLYLLATGAVWQGVALMAYGVLVISTVDNFLRPLLVGKDTKMPDYLVLVSTLGGIGIFGINGLVIGPVIAAMFIAAWDLFSASRREHFVLGLHLEAPQIVLASPCSGHGFKFASVIGEILTDLATDRSTCWPIGLFKPDRVLTDARGIATTRLDS